MLEFILGLLFGINSEKSNEKIYEYGMKKQIKNNKYVPKFSGYYKNEGTYLNEDKSESIYKEVNNANKLLHQIISIINYYTSVQFIRYTIK